MEMKFSWKLLGIAALIGLIIGGAISAIFSDLSFFCKYGIISLISQCTNHFVYPFLLVVATVGIYFAMLLLSMIFKKWRGIRT